MNFDSNALFRHEDIVAMRDLDEEDIEVVAVGPGAEEESVRAVTTIQVSGAQAAAVARHLRGMSTVRALHTTNGTWDLVAEITAPHLVALDATLSDIRAHSGVSNTETSILLTPL